MSLCLNFQLPSNPRDTWKTRSGSHRRLTDPPDFSRAASSPKIHKQTKGEPEFERGLLVTTDCNQIKDYSMNGHKNKKRGYFCWFNGGRDNEQFCSFIKIQLLKTCLEFKGKFYLSTPKLHCFTRNILKGKGFLLTNRPKRQIYTLQWFPKQTTHCGKDSA